MDCPNFKQSLSDAHVRVADILQDIERLYEKDADKGEHCLKVFNQSIDRFMPAFRYDQNRGDQERSSK